MVPFLRGTRVSDFAFEMLPIWPFATYVLLTIEGIALPALGLWIVVGWLRTTVVI